MHHIFVSENLIDEANGFITLTEVDDKESFNHLVKALRVGLGEEVLCSPMPFNFVFDYKCKVVDVRKSEIMFAIVEKTKANELPVKINLYQGLPKSDKLEFIIEKAVELGVYSITPVEMEFSIAKMGKKANDKIERLRKIAKSAAEQSKRNIIPEVREPLSFDEAISACTGRPVADKEPTGLPVHSRYPRSFVADARALHPRTGRPVADNITILFYENVEGIKKTKEFIAKLKEKISDGNISEINIIIGPEGGFSNNEIEKAKDAGITILSLGDRILRTETAAVTAMSIMMYELQK